MTVVARPSHVVSFLGGSINPPVNPCAHGAPRRVSPWIGEPGTVGRAVVVGAGKMGLPLAVQFARHGWTVAAVDVNPEVVAAINDGQSHVAEEPGLAEGVAEVRAAGRLSATTDGATAVREADVAVLIVPVMLDEGQQPDYRYMDSAVDSIAGGIHSGITVIFETTLPVGDTRGRFAPSSRRPPASRPTRTSSSRSRRNVSTRAPSSPTSRHIPSWSAASVQNLEGGRRTSTTPFSTPRSWP